MPMMKKKFVPKKPVKKFAKKVVRKSATAGIARATTALATVATHHNKLLTSLFDKMYFTYDGLNEEEVNKGFHSLKFNSSTNELPCHIFDLTMICNESNNPGPQLVLKKDASGYPVFQNAGPSQTLVPSTSDGSGYNPAQSLNRTLMEYYNCKLELFGRPAHKTKYNIALLQFTDSELSPSVSSSSAAAKFNQCWLHWVRPYVTNSIMPRDSRVMSDLKGKFKILWQKDYTINEQKSYNDELPRRVVTIYKKLNKLMKYNPSPVMSTVFQDDNPINQDSGATTSGGNSVTTDNNRRLWLVITANQTKDENATGYDQSTGVGAAADEPSDNIWYRTKHVVPAIGTS